MSSVKDATIEGVNTYIDGLRSGENEVFFSLVKFNSDGAKVVYASKPIALIENMDKNTYIPTGMTPLIDAAYKTIQATERAVARLDGKVDVIVVIQTDGEENHSVQYKADDLKKLVSAKRELGWQFVFIGAGIDAYAAGSAYGIDPGATVSYAKDAAHTTQMFRGLSASTSNYMAGAGSVLFSDEQKASAGDIGVSPVSGGDVNWGIASGAVFPDGSRSIHFNGSSFPTAAPTWFGYAGGAALRPSSTTYAGRSDAVIEDIEL